LLLIISIPKGKPFGKHTDCLICRSMSNQQIRKNESAVWLQIIDSNRTEINFMADLSNFEVLDDLYRRSRAMAGVKPECFPWYFDDDLRGGTIADYSVTAGLVGLTGADRMGSIARSRGDRDRAMEIGREAERLLREGYVNLKSRVDKEREHHFQGAEDKTEDFSKRVFGQSQWESTVSLAARAFIQLRNKEN
jgi:hypothetical protein